VKTRARRGLTRLHAAWTRYQEDDGPLLAAAVAYYLGLSLFPLLLILLAGLGWFLRFTLTGQSAEEQLLRTISTHLSPALVREVEQALSVVQDRSKVQGPIGLLTILTTTLAAFSQFDRAFDRIWDTPQPADESWWESIRRLLVQRGTAFLLLLGTGFFLFVVVAVGVVVSAVRSASAGYLAVPDPVWQGMQAVSAFLLNLALLAAIYRWLPKQGPHWLDAAGGACLAAVLWEFGRILLARFLIGASYSSAYGLVGSFIAILLWCYYAVTVIFLGAEFAQQLCQERARSHPGASQGCDPTPK
jgi:membrane protein